MYIEIRKLLFLERPHLTGERDVASYLELPAEKLYKLKELHADELVEALFHILKQMAYMEYETRVENSLNELDKHQLNCLVDKEEKAIHPYGVKDRAEAWFKHYAIPSIGAILPLEPDKPFSKAFEKKLLRIITLHKRLHRLMKIKRKCFFKKRERAEKLINEIRCYLADNSVGIYAILVYGFTLYSRKSKNYLMFDMHIQQSKLAH